jgi:hypothetical protein
MSNTFNTAGLRQLTDPEIATVSGGGAATIVPAVQPSLAISSFLRVAAERLKGELHEALPRF